MTTPPPVDDSDEVPDQEIMDLVQSLPDRAAVVLKKLVYRVRRMLTDFNTAKQQVQSNSQGINQLQSQGQNLNQQVQDLKARVTALGG